MMPTQEQIERDLKAALISGDKKTAETLKVLKSALQYESMNSGSRDNGLSDEQAQKVLLSESKKRQEAAELYEKAGEQERAQSELAEKVIIQKYLPKQMSEAEIKTIVDEEVSKLPEPTIKDMGRVIGAVKAKAGAGADGAVVARIVKEALEA